MRTAKWHQRYLALAFEIAEWSKSPGEKVGCVIVDPNQRQLCVGFNGFARCIDDSIERLEDKDERKRLMVHAEVNAIVNARMNLTGWRLYSTKTPCTTCASIIIQSGIHSITTPQSEIIDDNQARALALLKEAGVQINKAAVPEPLSGGEVVTEPLPRSDEIKIGDIVYVTDAPTIHGQVTEIIWSRLYGKICVLYSEGDKLDSVSGVRTHSASDLTKVK